MHIKNQEHIDRECKLDIVMLVMPIYNLFEYSDNDSMTST